MCFERENMATLGVVTQDLHSTPRRARPPTPTGVAVRVVPGAVGRFVAAVFDMAEISDIIGRNVICNTDQDSLRNLYNLRCSMRATRHTGKEVRKLVERIEMYLSLVPPVLKPEINVNMGRVKRSLMTLIQQKQWVRMIINWNKYIMSGEVIVSTIMGLYVQPHTRYARQYAALMQGNHSFAQCVENANNVPQSRHNLHVIASMLNAGIFNVIAQSMCKHDRNCALVSPCILLLDSFSACMEKVSVKFDLHLKILHGIINESIAMNSEYDEQENWFEILIDTQIALYPVALVATDEEDAMDRLHDELYSDLDEIRQQIQDAMLVLRGTGLKGAVMDTGQMAQLMISDALCDLSVCRTVDLLAAVVSEVIKWLVQCVAQKVHGNHNLQKLALTFLTRAMRMNTNARQNLLESGIVSLVVTGISINNHCATNVLIGLIDEEDDEEACDCTRVQFAYYLLIYEMLSTENVDDCVSQFSEAGALDHVIRTLELAADSRSVFAFEFPGTARNDKYSPAIPELGVSSYQTRFDHRIPICNIAELATVVLSKMCTHNEFSDSTAVYNANMHSFRSHNASFELLRMGLLAFTNTQDPLDMRSCDCETRENDLCELLHMLFFFRLNEAQKYLVKTMLLTYVQETAHRFLNRTRQNVLSYISQFDFQPTL